MFVPTYIMTVCYMKDGEIEKEVITLPYVPGPGHTIKLHGWKYRVLDTIADVDKRGIIIEMEEK